MIKKQIIFDFDGVIVDSHKVKNRAYYELFSKYGKKTSKKILSYHLQNEGKSRYIKFRYIIEKILNEKVTEKKLKFYSKKFDQITLKKIFKLKVSKSLLNFFKNNKNKFLSYISTGTPQKIINEIVKKKKIYHFFQKVYGSPKKKIEHIKKIKKNKKKTIFIGDSFEDFDSCKKTNTKFILKEHNENKIKFKKFRLFKIKNFKNFDLYLNDIKFK